MQRTRREDDRDSHVLVCLNFEIASRGTLRIYGTSKSPQGAADLVMSSWRSQLIFPFRHRSPRVHVLWHARHYNIG